MWLATQVVGQWVESLVVGQDVGGHVGVEGGTRPGRPPEVSPGAAAEVVEGRLADLVPAGRRRRVEPGRQRPEDLGVVARLGLLEDPLQRPPRPVLQRDPGDDREQAGPGERAVVLPERHEDLVQPEPIRQRHLGVGDSRALICSMRKCACSSSGLRRKDWLRISARSAGEGRRPLADGDLGRLILLVDQGLDEPDQLRIPRFPGAADVVQAESRRHGDAPHDRGRLRCDRCPCDRPGSCVLRAEIAMIPARVRKGGLPGSSPNSPPSTLGEVPTTRPGTSRALWLAGG